MTWYWSLLLILLLVLLATAKVTVQSLISRKYIRCRQDSVLGNVYLFSLLAAMMAVVFPLGKLNGSILLFAGAVGLGSFIFQTCYAIALGSGPVSLTVMLSNFTVLPVTVFSAVWFHEKIYLSQLIGIVFLVLSMIFSIQKNENEKKANGKWLIMVIVCVLGNGMANCVQKVFSRTAALEQEHSDATFLVALNALAALLALGCYLSTRLTGKKEKSSFGLSWRVILEMAIVSAILVAFQKLNLFAVGTIDGTLLFPTFAGLQSLCMTAVGILIFKDVLTGRQKWGICLGIVCVILMNLKFGIYLQF